ncbi:GNAT family N-acetyltransferase [Maribrevibacterium harenarium]|uniref:GNAT family N-acetyltransferase n=1 Tax=Maribrevibacterium harenarium TaxID=2589817 RepID=A0A501WZX5_9GAMM|nr:GNAT family N-acetyltransferase [Maribrevibacterium harenarium]
MEIQPYSPDKAREVTNLFYAAVNGIADDVYSPQQKAVWAPEPVNYAAWAARLAQTQPFLAICAGAVVGFMELEADGHIDCTYTHPEFQGRGVASMLYAYLETEAIRKGIGRLYVEASIVAKPFFSKLGFTEVKQNTLQRQGVELVNYSMEKQL